MQLYIYYVPRLATATPTFNYHARFSLQRPLLTSTPIFHFHTNRQQCGRRLARMDSSISQEEMQTTFSFRDESLVLPNGFQVACRIWGDPNATSRPEHRWLALHGWADNAASFDRLSPLLLREGAASCVVCIDAAGHGHRQVAHSLKYVASTLYLPSCF